MIARKAVERFGLCRMILLNGEEIHKSRGTCSSLRYDDLFFLSLSVNGPHANPCGTARKYRPRTEMITGFLAAAAGKGPFAPLADSLESSAAAAARQRPSLHLPLVIHKLLNFPSFFFLLLKRRYFTSQHLGSPRGAAAEAVPKIHRSGGGGDGGRHRPGPEGKVLEVLSFFCAAAAVAGRPKNSLFFSPC